MLPSYLSSSFFFFLLWIPPLSSSEPLFQLYLDCLPQPFRCGDFSLNLSYPFRTSLQHDYCGFPGFFLYCDNDNLTLLNSLGGGKLVVKDVDYFNHALTVVNVNFIGQSCPRTYDNVTINTSMFEYSDRNLNLTLYYNCSSIMSTLQPAEIQCLLTPTGRHSYYILDDGSFPELSKTCMSTVMVPVNKMAADQLAHNLMSFGDAVREGFMLKWIAGREWCSYCVRSGGVCGYVGSRPDAQTCFCPDGLANGVCSKGKNSKRKLIRIGALSGIGGLLLVGFLLFFIYSICDKESENDQIIEAFLKKHGSLTPKRYRYSEVKKMTKNFHDKLGHGGFGSVFKGTLVDGRVVAVKILKDSKGNGEEFLNEVASIGRTSHVNVVTLLGFCFNGSKRALIYEFMPNGSLDKYIHAEEPKAILGWERLFQITLGIAKGLEYLHRGCNTRIVHFDIKPHNILLDEEFSPKIADFGLAKLCPPKGSILSMADARGTVGYIAPEIFSRNFGVVSSKSDVYSYGMMLLEMAGGRKNLLATANESSQIYFPHWIYEHIDRNGDLQHLGVTNGAEEEIARKMILVGLWCIQTRPEGRPSISRVADMLQGSIKDLVMPPKPVLSSPPRPPVHSSTISLS